MKRAIILCLLLAGCATTPPASIIQTQEVDKAIPVSCAPTNMPVRPDLMTKDQVKAALAAATDFDDRVKIVSEQLLAYMGWTPAVEAALKGCESQGNSSVPGGN